MTSLKPKKRWCLGYHGKKMNEAIHAFPFDLCWKKHIEFQTTDKNQALELEAELMKWYDSVDNGYNTSEYGSGDFKRSEETKNKISKSMGVNGILQYSKDGEFIAEYPSTKEAERQTGCYQTHICKCCKGKLKSTGGFIWQYA